MLNLIYLIVILFFVFLINNLFKKKSILLNYTGERHQLQTADGLVPRSGGIVFFLLFLFIFFDFKNLFFLATMTIVFLIGLFSDLKILQSPKKRLLLQAISIFFCVYFLNLEIISTRILFFDYVLSNYFVNILFTIFCITIVVNGTNLIDGLNGLVIGYYSIILYFLLNLNFFYLLDISPMNINLIFLIFFILLVLNFFNKLFIGDGGAYLLGFLFSVWAIFLQYKLLNISPFYIILLLWYPCFENLFSIIRKKIIRKNPFYPDTDHLHQLFFNYIKNLTKCSKTLSNTISSIIINIFNFIIIYVGNLDPYNTSLQIFCLITAVFIYIVSYFLLFNFKNKYS